MEKKTGTAAADGRADQAVSSVFDISRAQAAKAIDQKRVFLRGEKVLKASAPVMAGDMLEILLPEIMELAMEKQDIPLTILYQDDELAVVDKPWGMVVHPGAGVQSGTLVNALLFALEDLSGIGGVKRPGIVHRLDKDTSGLLLVAKNDAAHLSLSAQLKARTMEKHYRAVVEGEMKEISGQVQLPIGRSKRDRKRMAIDPEGREAVTQWTLLENLRNAALLDVRILTGRTHQIRVHMQSLHHPVAGDPIYGLKNGVKVSRLMLHSYSLAFDHPRSGERMEIVAEPPVEFCHDVDKLRAGKSTSG